jgi:cation:H+ antiporter
MSPFSVVLFVGGLVALILGAEALVRGASLLAARLGISPLVVGLTVVAFGTSAPELVVSLQSALAGRSEIALGNALGSNIFNVLFVLGASAAVRSLSVSRKVVRLDVPVMILVCGLVWGLALDGMLSRAEGSVLAVLLVAYTGALVALGHREGRVARAASPESTGDPVTGWARSVGAQLVLIAVGLALLVLGSRWFVDAAVTLARSLGVNDLVIGLTLVAGGTSLPEAATSLLAAVRGQRDIAVGNVVGSNVFNMLGVLGVTSALIPGGLPVPESAIVFDFPVMMAVMVACFPIFFTGLSIARWEGVLFLSYYAAYATYLVLRAGEHEALEAYGGAMLVFVVPLTFLTLGTIAFREWRGAPRE